MLQALVDKGKVAVFVAKYILASILKLTNKVRAKTLADALLIISRVQVAVL